MKNQCTICKKEFEDADLYEYRGVIACDDHFDEVISNRNFERQEIIEEQKHKTDKFKGLDLSDSQIGKANRDILKTDIQIAKKESKRILNYEERTYPHLH